MSRIIDTHKKNQKMVQISLLCALLVVLQLLATMLVKIGVVAPTLALVPIVIAGAMFGIGGGAILGALFGIVCFLYGFFGLDAFTNLMLGYKPIETFTICMAKGILAGVFGALIYKAVMKISKNKVFPSALASAIICPVINTVIYLFGMAIFFRDMTVNGESYFGFEPSASLFSVFGAMFLMVITNFILEVIVTAICSPILAANLAKSKKFGKLFVR